MLDPKGGVGKVVLYDGKPWLDMQLAMDESIEQDRMFANVDVEYIGSPSTSGLDMLITDTFESEGCCPA